ncbi:MAG: sigma-70 family RNA polymerase sigma factor [Melioribacteraceae bacterium]
MKVVKDVHSSSMMNETDEDLMVIISMKDDPEACNLAFSEFHRRFKRFLFGMAFKVTLKLPNSNELREAVFQNTLINVYKYSGSFSAGGESDPEKIKRRIHGWLVKIEKRELIALLEDKQPVIDPEELNTKYENECEKSDETNDQPTYSEEIIEEALKLLSERDQHIFMTYWLYYEHGVRSQAKNLPDDVLEDLASKYETTLANIRKIIERSKKKVFAFLKENFKTDRR